MLLARLVGLVLLLFLVRRLAVTGLLLLLLAAVRLVPLFLLFFLVLLLSLLFFLLLVIHEKLKYLHYNRAGAQGMRCACHARLTVSNVTHSSHPEAVAIRMLRICRNDSETQKRKVQAVFAQAGSQDGETEEPGNLSDARGGRKT